MIRQPTHAPQRRLDEPQCKDIPWECGACGNRLAFVDEPTKTQVRIKFKDLFIWVDTPKGIKMTCSRCGATNELKEGESPPEAGDE